MPCIQPAFYAVFSSHADGPCNMQISGDTPMLLVSQSLPFALRKTRRGAQGNVSSGMAFLMLPSCALFPHCPHTDLVPVPLPLSPECSSFSLRPGRQVGRPGWRQAFRSISTGPFVLARLSSQLIVTHRFVYWFSSFSPPLICNFYETQLYVFYNILPAFPCQLLYSL